MECILFKTQNNFMYQILLLKAISWFWFWYFLFWYSCREILFSDYLDVLFLKINCSIMFGQRRCFPLSISNLPQCYLFTSSHHTKLLPPPLSPLPYTPLGSAGTLSHYPMFPHPKTAVIPTFYPTQVYTNNMLLISSWSGISYHLKGFERNWNHWCS